MMDTITIKDKGSFFIGGHKHILGGLPVSTVRYASDGVVSKMDPNGEYQVGQMYVQYTRLAVPRCPYPVLLCHGGGMTGAAWETTPDGRPGWELLLLRRGFDVFVSDSVERGRASWARYPEINPGPPVFKTYKNVWEGFRFGPSYPEVYPGLQFPTEYMDTFMKQEVPRWTTSGGWTQIAFNEYLSAMKGGCILISHSAGCLYAECAAARCPENVKASILLEPAHLPFGTEENVSIQSSIPHLCLWGDYIGTKYQPLPAWTEESYYKRTPEYFEALQQHGGDAQIIDLPKIGIHGNSHMLMMDRNNVEVLNTVLEWLKLKLH